MRKKSSKKRMSVTPAQYRAFKNFINAEKVQNLQNVVVDIIVDDLGNGVIYEDEINEKMLKMYFVDSILDDDDVKSIITSMLNFNKIAYSVKDKIITNKMYDKNSDDITF